MSDDVTDSPLRTLRRLARSGWRTMLTIYYANSVSWRLLKSGALVFLGFFAWAGASILLSYRPGWTFLHYLQAYGFLLVGYGPFHHLVVIPIYQRLRRRGRHLSLGGHFHLPNWSLAVFVALVIVLGTFPAGAMTIDFTSALGDAGVDVDPALLCVKGEHENGTDVHCHLSESEGIDRVVVRSGDRTILTDEEPPFDFTVRGAQLESRRGEKRVVVDLLDADGSLIRRYTRKLSRIDRE
ncbi:MAG: hypothetical protein ABEH88_05745 [Halobacteriales archaeon]